MAASSSSGCRAPRRPEAVRRRGAHGAAEPQGAGRVAGGPGRPFSVYIGAMSRMSLLTLATLVAGSNAYAQAGGEPPSPCVNPAAIVVRGNARVDEATVRGDAGLSPGSGVTFRSVQKAVKALYATGQYDDVQISCAVSPDGGAGTLVIQVKERPILGDVAVVGVDRLSERTVRDRVEMLIGRPIDPAQVAQTLTRIDSLYESEGYYLARVRPETTLVDGRTKLTFRIEEGRRLAVSGVQVDGNRALDDGTVVGSMKTRPEGFWWFRRGEFDDDEYAGDLAERLPQLYAKNGHVDFQVTRDTLIVD